jgi:two-component system, NtrC family, response regulator HydG
MDLSRYWKTIVNTLQDGVMVVDPGGRILAVNPAAERLTGYSEAELIGKSCRVLDCTGCKIIGEGDGNRFCGLFARGGVRAKKCLITNKAHLPINIIKNARVLRDEDGKVIGAVETLTDMSEIVRQQEEILALKRTLRLKEDHHGIVGKSPPMQQMFELIDNVARTQAPVLIRGESGTGKELVARAIHERSQRRKRPFIKVNCAALNENLLESELFGHVKGAYTGADRSRMGRFESAHGGTIFLDEIGDIPPHTQVKLLRVLEEKEIERVGENRAISVDVRVVTATNRDLEGLIDEGRFREDLYFRINVFPLNVPALRERREDVPIIVQHFLRLNNAKTGKRILELTPAAMEKLVAYDWPGNVRELRNAIEDAFVLCHSGAIKSQHLPPKVVYDNVCAPSRASSAAVPRSDQADDQRAALLTALRGSDGNQSAAARVLGVSRVTVWKRIKKYGIDLRKEV